MLKIKKCKNKKPVYDITVENNHNFYANNILVHNCQEILLPTTPLQSLDDENGEIALCVLAAVNVGVIKNINELERICKYILYVLDWVIDNQTYPFKAAEKMLKRRSVGVGMTNLAYYFAKNNVVYGSDESVELADELAESIQYYLLKASNELAQEKGKCEWFHKTKYSEGILPIDTYCKEVDKFCKRKLTHDWESLRKDIVKYGLRNSVLTAQMPVESSSLVTGSTNGIEPPRAPIVSKTSKRGLITQVVPEITRLKNKYTYAFDIDNIGYNKVCAVIQKHFDQSISANHYWDPTRYSKGILPLEGPIKDIIHAYKVGLKNLYYSNIYDNMRGSEDIEEQEEKGCASGACTL